MPISFGGINTGLPPNIVDQLMQAERIPVKKMEEQKGKSEARLKLVGELETKISEITKSIGELAGTRGFTDMRLLSSDPNVVDGVVDPNNYVPGSWELEVVELAHRPAAITNGFPDKDRAQMGIGYFKFETPEGTKQVFIDSNNNTLEGAAKAINMANVGVRAAVVNDRKDPSYPYKIVISGLSKGAENQVNYPTLYFLDGDQDVFFDENREARNGKIKIDGFEVDIADNTLTDLIPGVTLDLKNAAPGKNVTITVKENEDVVSGKIKTFVDSMNSVLKFIQDQNALSEKTDTSRTLGGDGLLRNIENRLRQLILSPQYGVGGSVKRLSDLGIVFNRNGTLDFEQKKFQSVLSKKPADVQRFLAGDGLTVGFIPRLRREVTELLNTAFGPISNRKKGLQSRIDTVNKQIENKERILVRREETLRRQFSKLEETISKLKQQGAALGSMVMPNLGGMSGAPTGG